MSKWIAEFDLEDGDTMPEHMDLEYKGAKIDFHCRPKEPILDKIRAEIDTKYGQCDICEYFEDYDYEENDISEYRPIGDIADILQIIDKYKAESEVEDGNDD